MANKTLLVFYMTTIYLRCVQHLWPIPARRVFAGGESGRGVNSRVSVRIVGTLPIPRLVLVKPHRLLSSLREPTVIAGDLLQGPVLGRHYVMAQRGPITIICS